MRPRSIFLFDVIFLTTRVVSTIPAIYYAVFLPSGSRDDSSIVLSIIDIMWIPLALGLLWFFISRKASIIAKWVATLFVAYELLAAILNWEYLAAESGPYMWVVPAVTMLDISAINLLYTPEARQWFSRKRRFGTVSPGTFD